MNKQEVMIKIRYNMSEALSLPDDKYETITVVMPKRNEDGVIGKAYTNLRDRMKTIDVHYIDSDYNLLDENDNIIMEPDNPDQVPLRIDNKKIFSATWLKEKNNE